MKIKNFFRVCDGQKLPIMNPPTYIKLEKKVYKSWLDILLQINFKNLNIWFDDSLSPYTSLHVTSKNVRSSAFNLPSSRHRLITSIKLQISLRKWSTNSFCCWKLKFFCIIKLLSKKYFDNGLLRIKLSISSNNLIYSYRKNLFNVSILPF